MTEGEWTKKDVPLPYAEAYHEEEINGKQYLTFSCPGNHPDSVYVTEEKQVAFKDEDGTLRLFVIKEIDEEHGAFGIIKHIYCEPAFLELSDEPIEDRRLQDYTVNQALTVALENTRWSVGTTDSLGLGSTNFYYESAKSAIEKILDTWGGEIRDRVEISGSQIVGRYIDILTRRGADTGKRFEIGKDVSGISRKVLSYPVTALYGRGKGVETDNGGFTRKVTFDEVTWTTTNGDPVDKPYGQKWVGDPDALALFGRENGDGTKRHRFGFVEFSEEDPETVLNKTWAELQTRNTPTIQYELSVVTLEHLSGYAHEKVRLGDTTAVIDRQFFPDILIESRVISIKRNLKNASDKTVKLGNFIDIYKERKRLAAVESKLNDRSDIWNKVEEPIVDTDFPDTVPPTPTNAKATGLFKYVVVEWDYIGNSYVSAYEVYASQVTGFTPDSSNLVWKGKAGGYIHQGAVNEQWYFRVRAVNTHGTPSDFTAELTATTVQINAGTEVAPLTITNALIAETAAIDWAKIGNVEIVDADIVNVTWDKAQGGTATLGGANNGNGRLVVLDENGETVADLDAVYGGFKKLFVDDLESPSTVRRGTDTITYYVASQDGTHQDGVGTPSDSNSGTSWSEPLATIAEAVRRIPQYLAGVSATIWLEYSGTYYESINISGFTGSGSITVDGQSLLTELKGNIDAHKNTLNVRVNNMKVYGTDSYSVVSAWYSDFFLYRVHVYGVSGNSSFGIDILHGSFAQIQECEVYDVNRAISARYGGTVMNVNNKGYGDASGLYTYSGEIMGYGTCPDGAGTIANSSGGETRGSFTADSGSYVVPPPPETTDSWTQTDSASWRDNWGWRTDNSDVYQGEWDNYGHHRGFWFFGSSPSTAVTGKTIKKMRIYVTRASSGGYSSTEIRFGRHDYTSQPSGDPVAPTETFGITFSRGESKWVELPSGWFADFEAGTAKGVGIYTSSTANTEYAIMNPSATLEITYA